MKFNVAYPTTGAQKTFEIDDERKIRHFLDKRLAAEVDGEHLGDQFKGYVFKITGGHDKQGFAMKQGVLIPGRVRLLLSAETGHYRPHRHGERRRKSVRGCIVSGDIAALNLVIVKKGPEELPGLTDKIVPKRLGPKRASKIRKLFNLSKEDDVRKYVIRRELPPKKKKDAKEGEAKEGEEGAEKKPAGGAAAQGQAAKKRTKAPKIQRLVTPLVLQRKRHRLSLKKRAQAKSKQQAAEYAKLVAQRSKEARQSQISSRRSASMKRASEKKEEAAKPAGKATGTPKAPPAKPSAKSAGAAKAPAAKPAAAKAAAAKGAAPKGAAAKPAAAAAKPPAAKGAAAKPAAAKPAAKAPAAAAKPAAPAPKPAAQPKAKAAAKK